MPDCEVFIGWDDRERAAWEVCARSIIRNAAMPPTIRPISMQALREIGRYKRPTDRRDGVLFDEISNAPMATEFAIARFFVPLVARARWALFVDADFMFRADVAELFALADPRYAVQVVQHPDYAPHETIKMDGQPQSGYARKNWSSMMLWNMNHAGAACRMSLHDANTRPGLWLHQFAWVHDGEIGALPAEWNWLEGISDPGIDPKAVHFTRGTPDIPGYENSAYADEWAALAGHKPVAQRAAA
ncbi:MAG: hypothetical protein NUV34_01060 [Sulfuricaulis sp.]|nr:hypothetical protein [Sulfuricaulis sp.]